MKLQKRHGRTERLYPPCQCEHKDHKKPCKGIGYYVVHTQHGPYSVCDECLMKRHMHYTPNKECAE